VRSSRRSANPVNGVDFLITTYLGYDPPPVLVAVAPLSNIAAAIQREPSYARGVGKLVIMGGGWHVGT